MISKLLDNDFYSKRIIFWLPFILFVFTFCLRVYAIKNSSLFDDELFSLFYSQKPLLEIIRDLKPFNNPPLFEMILHYQIQVFGITKLSLRFLPCLFSSLTVIYIFLIGKKYVNLFVGMIGSLLFSFSTYHEFFAHCTRTYGMLMFFSIASFFYLFSYLTGKKTSSIILYVLLSIINIYLHFLGILVLIIHFILMISWIKNLKRKDYMYLGIAYLSIGVGYIPYMVTLFERFNGSKQGTWVSPASFSGFYEFFRFQSNRPIVAVAFLILILSSFFLSFLKKIKFPWIEKVIMNSFWLPLLFLFVISYEGNPFKIPLFIDRYLIFFSPFYFIYIALLIDKVFKKRTLKISMASLGIILMAVTFQINPDNKRHVEELMESLSKNRKSNQPLIVSSSYFELNFLYYYDKKLFTSYFHANQYNQLINTLKSRNVFILDSFVNLPEKVFSSKEIIFLDADSKAKNPKNGILEGIVKRKNLKRKDHFYEIYEVYYFQ